MTIRFAAAWGGSSPVIMRSLCLSAPLNAANDNRRPVLLRAMPMRKRSATAFTNAGNDGQALTDALRHFGRHGLAAATKAREYAEAAHAAGDAKSRDHWIGICGQLDRRMARTCTRALNCNQSRPG